MARNADMGLDAEIENLLRELLAQARREIAASNPAAAERTLTQVLEQSEGDTQQEAELLLVILRARATSQENLRLLDFMQSQIANATKVLVDGDIAAALIAQDWVQRANLGLLLLVEIAGRGELREVYVNTQRAAADLKAGCTTALDGRIDDLLLMPDGAETLRTQLLQPTQPHKPLHAAIQNVIAARAIALATNGETSVRTRGERRAILMAAGAATQDNPALTMQIELALDALTAHAVRPGWLNGALISATVLLLVAFAWVVIRQLPTAPESTPTSAPVMNPPVFDVEAVTVDADSVITVTGNHLDQADLLLFWNDEVAPLPASAILVHTATTLVAVLDSERLAAAGGAGSGRLRVATAAAPDGSGSSVSVALASAAATSSATASPLPTGTNTATPSATPEPTATATAVVPTATPVTCKLLLLGDNDSVVTTTTIPAALLDAARQEGKAGLGVAWPNIRLFEVSGACTWAAIAQHPALNPVGNYEFRLRRISDTSIVAVGEANTLFTMTNSTISQTLTLAGEVPLNDLLDHAAAGIEYLVDYSRDRGAKWQEVEGFKVRLATEQTPTLTPTVTPPTPTATPQPTNTATNTPIPAPKVPTITKPSDGAIFGPNDTFTFQWSTPPLAESECVELVWWPLGTGPRAARGLADARTTCKQTAFAIAANKLPGGTYFWSVRIVQYTDRQSGTGYQSPHPPAPGRRITVNQEGGSGGGSGMPVP